MCVHNYAVWCTYKFVYVYQIRSIRGPVFIQFHSLISIPSSTYILEKPTVIIQILHMIQFKVRNSTLGIYRESNSR